MMEPALAPFGAVVGAAGACSRRASPSSRTSPAPGSPTAEATDPGYWARHLRAAGALRRRRRRAARRAAAGAAGGRAGDGPGDPGAAPGGGSRARDRLDPASPAGPGERDRGPAGGGGRVSGWPGCRWLQRAWRSGRCGGCSCRSILSSASGIWIEAQPTGDRPAARGPVRKKPDLADWFYLPSFQRTLPSGALSRRGGPVRLPRRPAAAGPAAAEGAVEERASAPEADAAPVGSLPAAPAGAECVVCR